MKRGVVGMTFFRVLVFSLCFAVLAAASASAEEVLKIKPRSGVFLKMLVDAPAAAKAVVLLLSRRQLQGHCQE